MMPKKRMSQAAKDRRNAKRRKGGEQYKPPPPKKVWEEGVDYFCGGCAGHRVIYCPDCIVGCPACKWLGKVACPACNGGAAPVPPPDWS